MDKFDFNLGPLAFSGTGYFAAALAFILAAIVVIAIVTSGNILPALVLSVLPASPSERGDE